jgi:YbbR domain-containing protein
MAIIKLSATERRRVSVFFTCLLLAGIAWVLVTLSRTYNFTVRHVLTYQNTPQHRAFHSLQPDTVNITVKGTGWQMLFAKMNSASHPVKIDLRTLDRENYVVLKTQIKDINKSHELQYEVVGFDPDTLYFDFSNRSVKRVPVRLIAALKYQQQFARSDDITIKPAYVTITGPSNRIDGITVWKTDSLKADDVDETIKTTVNLEPVKEGNISIYPKSVQVIVPVNEFTEKTIEVPVKLINNTEYYNVKVFPLKVRVTFTTPLNKYTDINEEYFEAQADLDLWKKRNYKMLPVKLAKIPDFCKIVKIEPQYVDFIIKK